MADDIVTRLRTNARMCNHGYPNGLGDSFPSPTECSSCRMWLACADEIERLRVEINDSTKALSRNATALMKQVEENIRLRAECNATRHITEHFSQEADRA